MANLPSQHPTLSIHLSDMTLTPLITSSSSPSHLDSLTSLASSALSSQTAASRAHLGRPQRIMVEYADSGPVLVQTYLDPRDATPDAIAARAEEQSDQENGQSSSEAATSPPAPQATEEPLHPEDAAPLLVGLVVAASSDEAREARRAAARLERIGRRFQTEWTAQTERAGDAAASAD